VDVILHQNIGIDYQAIIFLKESKRIKNDLSDLGVAENGDPINSSCRNEIWTVISMDDFVPCPCHQECCPQKALKIVRISIAPITISQDFL